MIEKRTLVPVSFSHVDRGDIFAVVAIEGEKAEVVEWRGYECDTPFGKICDEKAIEMAWEHVEVAP